MQNTAEREISTRASFNVPLAKVWEAWSNPAQIINWWGPSGFSTTISKMDFREGAEWNLTLHGPDGTKYPNKSIFREIVRNHKIVFEHFNPSFIAIIIFKGDGNSTELNWTLRFETAEMRDIVVKAHNAVEGQKQNMERLRIYLESGNSNS